MTIGLLFTPWRLNQPAGVAAAIALLAAGLLYVTASLKGRLRGRLLLVQGIFYVGYVVYVVARAADERREWRRIHGRRQDRRHPGQPLLVVEVVESRDRGVKRASRWAITAVEALVTKEVLDPSESGDHRAVVQVSDRWSHDIVYVQDWVVDAAAHREQQTLESDLERMDIQTFFNQYSIDWSPPSIEPDDSGV